MKQKFLKSLVLCSLICLAMLCPQPAQAQTNYNKVTINAAPELTITATLPDLRQFNVVHSFPPHAFNPDGSFTQEFLNALDHINGQNRIQNLPQFYDYATSNGQQNTLIARHVRHRSVHRSNRYGSSGFTRSRCSGGICQA